MVLQSCSDGTAEFGILLLGFVGWQALGGEGLDRLVADGDHCNTRTHHVFITHRVQGQNLFGHVARAGELGHTRGVELERALGRVGGELDLRVGLRGSQCRVGRFGQHLEDGEVGQHGNQQTGHDDGLAADLVGQATEEQEERCANNERDCHQDVGRSAVHLQRTGQEELGVELAGVPDHGLAHRQTDQGQNHDLQVLPLAERLGQRCLGGLALGLHLLERWRFTQRQTDPH